MKSRARHVKGNAFSVKKRKRTKFSKIEKNKKDRKEDK